MDEERTLTVRAEMWTGYVRVRCPFHDDHNPSASLRFANGEPVLLYCFACGGGEGPARFKVVKAIRSDGGSWHVTVRPARRGRSRKPPAESAARGKPTPAAAGKKKHADGEGEDAGLVAPAAVNAALQIAVAWIRDGRKTTQETLEIWKPFFLVKKIPTSLDLILALAYPPILSPTAIIYPLVPLADGGEAVERYQIRLVAGAKGRFYPPGTSAGKPWGYAPRGLQGGAKFVVVEAAHHALRIALLLPDVLPVAALGIGNIPAVVAALSEIGRVAAVFCDEPIAVLRGVIALDIDEISDQDIIRHIAARLT